MIYLFIVIFSFSLVLLNAIYRKSKTACIANSYCLFLLFLLLVCVMGFRYRVGLDTLNYMENYSQVPLLADFSWEYFFEGRYEFLYVLLVNISRIFSDSFFSKCFNSKVKDRERSFIFFYKKNYVRRKSKSFPTVYWFRLF